VSSLVRYRINCDGNKFIAKAPEVNNLYDFWANLNHCRAIKSNLHSYETIYLSKRGGKTSTPKSFIGLALAKAGKI
jgi:hypothetical protein